MTTDWKPTIHQAYTTPNLSNPVLQKAIPSLIRDEIHKLANITLFQKNVDLNHKTSQVPVDMRFTDDSLNIRISKNAPWISLLPSKNPLSPEEQTVDAIRRDVMEKIALLWGGIPNNSSDESDHQHTNTPGSSGRDRSSRSTRTRSKQSRRAQQNKGMGNGEKSPITISKNKIDASTHTTNNYYSCHSRSQHLLANIGKAETETPKKNMYTQTDPAIDLSKNFEEIHSPEDSRDNIDSSNDESKQSSSSSSDGESRMGNKTSTSTKFEPSDTSDLGSESSCDPDSSDESEQGSIQSFNSKSTIREKKYAATNLNESNTSDLESESSSDQSKQSSISSVLSKIVSQTDLQSPKDSSRISRTRSMPIEIQEHEVVPNDGSTQNSLESIHNVEELVSIEDISRLHTFINNSISETDAFIEIANSIEEEIDPQTTSSLLKNRDIFINIQSLLDSDPQLISVSHRVNILLDQLHLDTLQLIHNDSDLEIPYINREDSSDDESTLVGSLETVFENENSVDEFIDDEIRDQPIPSYVRMNTLTDEDTEELDSLLDSNLFREQKSNNEIRSTSTQTDTHLTDHEIQLQEKLRKLQTVLERTKSMHKEELASLLRAQDHLQSEAKEKIKGVLQSSIESEKDAFSRLQHSHEKYTKLLEDTAIEIADLKKTLAELETIDLAKQTEFDSFRSKVYSPTPGLRPTAIKVETKTEATQVTDMATPTDIDVKSIIPKAKANRATASSSNSNQNDRNLAAASMIVLRKEKAALELAIQKNQFPKSQLAGKKDLLQRIDEELIRRNQSPQSKKNKEYLPKKPLNQKQRNRIDLGREAFIKEQHTLNNKRTINK